MSKENSFFRSWMWLCFGTAILFLAVQCQSAVSNTKQTERKPKPKPTVIAKYRYIPPSPQPIDDGKRLVVDLSDRRVYLYDFNQQIGSYPVGVGKKGWETPTGSFKITRLQKNPVWKHPITGAVFKPGEDNPLGDRWIGFWSDGKHDVGFHGTQDTSLVGTPVSHGCLRMQNQDIHRIFDRVRLGTPVIVQE
ncbi:MAG: L,D-transpeptidase [Nostocaceae cyanobacterium]|nr:L,D-transpeptidase [Nostocaceae cyanobacterium]